MIRTPLLRPLRDNGATLYVFPSANEDIGLNLNSRATGVAMSHYALLNLPVMFGNTDPKTESIAIATDLQNYMMNLECTLLNQDSYNYQEYHTVPALIINSCNICGVFNAILEAVKASTKCPPFNNKIAN